MKPEVSICAAIYNIDEKFLRVMIESVTADKDGRIEIILGDDCSDKPHVEKICREYEKMMTELNISAPKKTAV